ncbi:UDP-N-acetylmuramate dehydrogenase [Propionicimonas paludicola]|uniref:UDP-N-acetylenolpyruvoylglucosamine reductase n=1 Tax=Propionicimonas paludicola TaxID=185243 RepID=A0A2A9CSC7_9ACTN|nr:UDP-N-acetylmuramate dehydrogenase [Propionicimonas paludicola]PFG17036.1 UDP-N-acetylmuramate dehydrogenase [Propionicimonas paludicola]
MAESLAAHTTFRIGGPAGRWLAPTSEAELIEAVAQVDAAGEPLLILGGGSNVLISDDGFTGTVVHTGALRGWQIEDLAACAGAFVNVAAGEPWDDFVQAAIEHEWVGIEALSGIPGLTGSTPIQNVGAYGQEVAQTIARVRVYDRAEHRVVTRGVAECHFGYRSSLFKAIPNRFVVLSVSFQFRLGGLSAPIRYAELARRLGVAEGERAPLGQVREAVLALRKGKGMVCDPEDPDSWSAGSFFTNPLLTPEQADRLPAEAPRFPQPDGRVKTSAAWLIEHAGFGKGFAVGAARVSTKHSLALVNPGTATATDVLTLAATIREGVATRYGVLLSTEPVLVGVTLNGQDIEP